MLIACIINLTITNCIPVYATVPGVVEAEGIWSFYETLALTLGVTLEFDPTKTISKNNQFQYDMIKGNLDKELADGVITQSQYNAALDNLDNNISVNGVVGSAMNIGQDLWSSLTRLYFSQFVESQIDLYSGLSGSQKQWFDNYQGRCGIYSVTWNNGSLPQNTTLLVILGNNALQNPVRVGSSGGNTAWYVMDQNQVISYNYFYNTSSQLVENNYYPFFAYFEGDTINVQYWDNKQAFQDIPVNSNENALTSAATYQDYLDKLADIYELLDGKIVVKDTGEAPTVLDGDTIADTVADIQDGVTSWENAIPAIQAAEGDTTGDIVGENSVIGKKALDELVTGLNVSQIQNKFPFCIPSDIKEIASGAATVSGNAPVITIPLKLEFAGTTYYEDNEAVVIDFKDFSQLALIFRKGFLLLFLVGMIYLSIYVISSFFHVTE